MAPRVLFISGIELPNSALVIRSGILQIRDLRRNALDNYERYGFYGVSAWAGIDVGLEDLLVFANMHNSYIATSTAGDIRSRGFDVELTGPPKHCTIDLGTFPSGSVLVRLKASFGDFVSNRSIIELP